MSKLNEELASAKETNERLNRDYFEKTSILNEIEKKINVTQTNHAKRIDEMREEFNSQKTHAERTRGMLENAKKLLENLKYSEQDMIEKCTKSEVEIEMLKEKSTDLKRTKEETTSEIDSLNGKLRHTINLESLSKSLCQRCVSRLNEAFSKMKNSENWLQAATTEEEIKTPIEP